MRKQSRGIRPDRRDRLVAAARDSRRLEALVEKYPDQVRTAALDVVDEDAARAAATAKALKPLWGSDAVQYAGQAEAARAADADRWRKISVSTDVSASGPIPAL